MAWECAECGEIEKPPKVLIDAVCHHCGKPLCRKCRDRNNTITDPAFAQTGNRSRTAYHCVACRRQYHS